MQPEGVAVECIVDCHALGFRREKQKLLTRYLYQSTLGQSVASLFVLTEAIRSRLLTGTQPFIGTVEMHARVTPNGRLL